MQIRVEIVKRDENLPDSERQAIHVETHVRRGDSFSVQKVDNVLEGSDAVTFNIPSGGRIIINTPLTTEEMVYDRDQMAAVKLSQQRNPENMAADSAAFARANPPGLARPAPPLPDGTQPQGMAPNEASGRRYKPANVVDTTKQEQQTSAGRPAGENPPKPGSPVGSPPDGNEGEDQK